MSERETLKPNQAKFVQALLQGNVTSAMAAAGVKSRRTAYRWLKQPAVKAALHEAEGAALAEASRGLLRLAEAALAVLDDVLDVESGATETGKLRAASLVLENLLRLKELSDFGERLNELENKGVNNGYFGA